MLFGLLCNRSRHACNAQVFLWDPTVNIFCNNPLILQSQRTQRILKTGWLGLQPNSKIHIIIILGGNESEKCPLFVGSPNCPRIAALLASSCYRDFAIQEWADDANNIVMGHIPNILSIPDRLTKAPGWVLHSCHVRRMKGYFLKLASYKPSLNQLTRCQPRIATEFSSMPGQSYFQFDDDKWCLVGSCHNLVD